MPSWEFDRLSVGYDEIRRLIKLSLMSLELPGLLSPLFIRGEWGSGKTHFLSYLQIAANYSGIAAAKIELNGRSAPLNYPQRFLSVIAESMQVGELCGVKEILLCAVRDPMIRTRLLSFAESNRQIDIGSALADLCQRVGAGADVDPNEHPIWPILYGTDLSWSDHQTKRNKALFRIGTLGLLSRIMGFKGLVLIFDEAETIDQLWNVRSRVSAFHVLGSLFGMDAVWCVFGTTGRFDRTINTDIANGLSSCDLGSEEASNFLNGWQSNHYQRHKPPVIDARRAKTLGMSICSLYERAYGKVDDLDNLLEKCLSDWQRNPARNPRRLI